MALVDRHHAEFDDRNAFLQVLLGVLSLCRGFAKIAVELGPAPALASPTGVRRADPVLDAMVGLASLVHRTAAHIEAAAADASPGSSPPPEGDDATPTLRSLLA